MLSKLVLTSCIVLLSNAANASTNENQEPAAEQPAAGGVFDARFLGARLGVVVPVLRGKRFNPQWSVAAAYRLEATRFFLDFATSLNVAYPEILGENINSYWTLQLELGAAIRLMQGSIMPFVEFGVAPRFMLGSGGAAPSVHEDIAPFGEVGVDLGGTIGTRYYVLVRALQFVMPYKMSMWPAFQDRTQDRYPTELTLLAGIGW